MTDTPTYPYDLFVAHAGADRAWVAGYLLPALGLPAARTQTRSDFRLGAPLVAEFERAVTSSRYTLLVITPAYLADEWGTFGDQLAAYAAVADQRDRLIPLLLAPCTLPLHIESRVSLDCTDPDTRADEIARLRQLLDQPEPPPERIPCPYPGLVPFAEKDARFFYGRGAEIAALLDRLRVQPFLLIVGPSGSGKSSLVFAGMLPQIPTSSFWPPGTWLVRTLRPGPHPLPALAATLEGGLDAPLAAVAALLAAHPPATRLLLLVDQFEELFTLSDPPRRNRFIAVLKTLRADARCTVLLTMRADFYADLMNSDLWPVDASARLEIAALHGAGLRQAIEAPAAAVGVYLETGLVEALLADAADEPGVLPLLQETMVLLWGQLQRRLVPLAAYQHLGADGRSGLAVAMATRADATLAALPAAQQTLARRIFLRLVQFGEGRTDTRRQQLVSDLDSVGDDPVLLEKTLTYLADNRLLTLGGGEKGQGRTVDIAHEALIAGWPILSGWLQQRRDAEQTRRRLEAKAAEWVHLGRGAGGLLDETELPEAERWLASADAADLGYDESLSALVQASRAALDRLAQDKEATARRELEQAQNLAAARQRELEQAQTLAAEQQRLAEEQQQRAAEQAAAKQRELEQAQTLAAEQQQRADLERRRADERARAALRLRGLAAGLLGLLILAAVLMGYAVAQRQADQRDLRVARAQSLAANAVAQLSQDPELSVLLAREAISVTQRENEPVVAQAEDALHQAVGESRLRGTLRGHADSALNVVYSPDGRTLATAGRDSVAKIWDVATGQELRTLRGHTSFVLDATYSPDGQRLVTSSADKTAKIWAVSTGELLGTLQGHTDQVWTAVYSPDGRRIATASWDKTIRVWDSTTGQMLQTFEGHTKRIWSVAWSPDGNSLVSASEDGTARVWDAQAPGGSGPVGLVLTGHSGQVFSAAYSPDGRFIVTSSNDGTAKVWAADNGQELFTLRGHRLTVNSAVFNPAGTRIATAGFDGTAKVWDATTGEELFTLRGHTDSLTGVAWSPDGRFLATSSRDRTAKIWDATLDGERLAVPGLPLEFWAAAYSPDGHAIVTSHNDSSVHAWDAVTGRPLWTATGHRGLVRSVAYSPDGHLVLTASQDKTAKIWNAATGQEVRTLRGHIGLLNGAAWSPDGRRIATASFDHTAKIWDAASGQVLKTLPNQGDFVFSVAWSPDGRFLALSTAGKTPTITIWDTGTWQLVRTLVGHNDAVNTVQYSPDGRFLVTASDDHTARIWDAGTGQVVHILVGHTREVYSAAWSPDGRSVVTASKDNTARIWDAASGRERTALHGHTSWVTDAVYSPDGRAIATSSTDGTARQHVATLADLLALAAARTTRVLTPDERASYLGEPAPLPAPTPTR